MILLKIAFLFWKSKDVLTKYLMISRSINSTKTWNCFHWKPSIFYVFVTYGSLLLRLSCTTRSRCLGALRRLVVTTLRPNINWTSFNNADIIQANIYISDPFIYKLKISMIVNIPDNEHIIVILRIVCSEYMYWAHVSTLAGGNLF